MGYLNITDEDEDSIANEGAMNGTTQLPGPVPYSGFGGAIGRSIVGGVANIANTARDAFGALADNVVGHAAEMQEGYGLLSDLWGSPSSAVPSILAQGGQTPEWAQTYQLGKEELRERQDYLDDVIHWSKLDPQYTGSASMLAGNAAKGLTEYGIGSVAGPWGAMALVGGSSADEAYHDLRNSPVYQTYDPVQFVGLDAGDETPAPMDEDTAEKYAAIVGLTNAAFAAFPVKFGKTWMGGTAKAVGAATWLGVASRYAQHAVLDDAGYHDMANTVRPFDHDAMLADAIMSGFFNAAGHLGAQFSHAPPEYAPRPLKLPIPSPDEVDAAAAGQAETHFNRTAFGIPTNPGTANLHVDTLAANLDAMSRDMDPAPIDPADAQALANGVIVDPQPLALAQAIHQALHADPEVRAVREAPTLPGLTDISDGGIADRFQQQIDSDFPAAVKQYAALEGSDNGRLLNTDIARELSPDYVANRTRSAAVHEPASALVKRMYADLLSQPTPEGRHPEVMFLGGGTGAGKTTGLGGRGGGAEITYDTNLSRFESADAKIRQALDAGRNARVVYVYRDPIDALTNGALTRATRMERESGSGRTVPLAEHLKTHAGALETIARLQQKYANDDRVAFHVIDNTRGRGNAREVASLADLPIQKENFTRERLTQALNEERAAGRISAAIHQGFLQKGRAEADGGVSEARQIGSSAHPGQSEPRAIDPITDERLRRLVNEHGTTMVTQDDGRQVTVAQAVEEVLQQAREAENFAKLFDAAVACFLDTGGAQ